MKEYIEGVLGPNGEFIVVLARSSLSDFKVEQMTCSVVFRVLGRALDSLYLKMSIKFFSFPLDCISFDCFALMPNPDCVKRWRPGGAGK